MKKEIDLLLLSPPINPLVEAPFFLPNIGLGYLASVAKKEGFNVAVRDATCEGLSFSTLFREIIKLNPKIIGITIPTVQAKIAQKLNLFIKHYLPETITIAGGWHSTARPREVIEKMKFDIVVRGEGEKTLVELLNVLFDNNCDISKSLPLLKKVRGICINTNKGFYSTPPREYIKNLDTLPFPAWELFNLKKIKPLFSLFGSFRKIIQLPILTSRGCPFKCVFCSRVMGEYVRFRSPENVIKEILHDFYTFNAKEFVFVDENFTLNKKRTEKICENIINYNLHDKIEWIAETRVDLVDEKLLLKMKKAGCKVLLFGVESGDNNILSLSKKGYKVETIKKAFKISKKIGLKTYASFILGLPGENLTTITKTIKICMEIDPDYVSFNILVPFPGTEVEEYARNRKYFLKLISEEWESYGKQIGCSLELETLPRKNLEKLQTYAYLKFYLRPTKIINLFRVVRDVKSFIPYLFHKISS